MITRRHVLAAAALLAGASTAGTGGVAWRWWNQAPSDPYAVLSAEEADIFAAFAEACYPAGGTPAIGGREANVARYFDAVLAGLAPEQRNLLRLSLHAIEALPLATNGSYFTSLSVPDASAAVASWLASSRHELRGLAQSYCVFVGMAWFAHPEVRRHMEPHLGCAFGARGGLLDAG